MNNAVEENLERKIKRNIYGKPQAVQITFPPGFGSIAHEEINFILKNLWFPQKFVSQVQLLENIIRINNVHMFAITEILMRSQCLSDIRLIIFEGKTVGKIEFEKKCRAINWNLYINKEMTLKIKVNSVASKAFHETGLKEILNKILIEHANEIRTGDNANETTCIYVNLYNDRLTISISLAGDPLYKKGYRETLSQSAPLREDYAACCIQNAFKFANAENKLFTAETAIIPFSGTGTFAFEYQLMLYNISPILIGRNYAMQKMPFYRVDNFNFLKKKAIENCLLENNIHISCIDNSKLANNALAKNDENFQNGLIKNNLLIPNKISQIQEDFIKLDMSSLTKQFGNVFVPINPPYGIRLGKNYNIVNFYKNIAIKINELSNITIKEKKNLLGFILCPNKESWSIFYKNLNYSKIETYHFTQGGMDIRVCQFLISSEE